MSQSNLQKLRSKIRTAAGAWREGGPAGVASYVGYVYRRSRERGQYRKWLREVGTISAEARAEMRRRSDELEYKPLISVVLPVYNVDERWLRACIDSVLKQIYSSWELCIADDASTAKHIRPLLEEYTARDKRINVVFRSENGHISAASNSALELATGEFIALLDHDDELSEDALFHVANEINAFPETRMIYSDEDLIDANGRRYDPKFKPDFSRDLLYSQNLVTHLSVYRTELVRSIDGFRLGFEGSQDYDLALRVLEQIDEKQIRHIPRVLYHWRVIEGSVAFSMGEKPYAHERARIAIREHFTRTGVDAEVFESVIDLHRVRYRMPDPKPSVQMIVSGSGELTPTGDFDVVRVEVPSARSLNKAATDSRSDVLVFLDAGLEAKNTQTIDELVSFALQPSIGAVAGRIIALNGMVEQAGIILDADLSPVFAHRGFPRTGTGNILRNLQIGNFSAVSISCLVIRRELFDKMGGFDESIGPFDIDLCLRLREKRKRVVVLPHVELKRRRPVTLPHFAGPALEEFRKRWPGYVKQDPFCNPNLKRDGSFEIDV